MNRLSDRLLTVRCPRCDAAPMQPCTVDGKAATYLHLARWDAVLRIDQDPGDEHQEAPCPT